MSDWFVKTLNVTEAQSKLFLQEEGAAQELALLWNINLLYIYKENKQDNLNWNIFAQHVFWVC